MLLVFVAVLVVYAATTPRSVVLEDDGEFITAVNFLGVGHPPGYPLYILLAKPFTWLPIGSIAFRVHMASCVFGAACCSLVWWALRTLLGNAWLAALAALALGVSDGLWSQSLIADVYSLNAAIFFGLICLCLAYVYSPRANRLALLALVYGLGLSNHWPLLVLATPGLLLILWPARAALLHDLRRRPLLTVLPLAIGLLPYAWMVVRSQAAPQWAFYGAIDSWKDFWFHVSRAGYAKVDTNPSAGWADKVRFAVFVLRQVAMQFTPLGAAIIAIGALVQWRRWRSIAPGLSAAFLGSTVALLALVSFEYDYLTRAIFRPYPVLAYGIMAFWLGLGLEEIRLRLAAWSLRTAQVVSTALGLAIVAATFAAGLTLNDRHGEWLPQTYATTLLSTFEPNAVLFTHGDVDTLVFSYFHFVEGMRPDIRLLNDQGLSAARDGRLFDPRRASKPEIAQRILAFVRQTDRPVYFIDTVPYAVGDNNYGFYYKVDRSNDDLSSFEVTPDLLELYRRILVHPERDPWITHFRSNILKRFTRVLTGAVTLGGAPEQEKYQIDLDQAALEFSGLWPQIWFPYEQGSLDAAEILKRVEQAESLIDDTVSRTDQAQLYDLKARLLRTLGRDPQAITALRRSVEIRNHPDNPAVAELARLSAEQKVPHPTGTPGNE
jgi:Protein O-mannosyl-transferase TMEM260-like